LRAKTKRLLWSLPFIMFVAFVVRFAIYYPTFLQTYNEVALKNFPYGAETGMVAAAIAEGRGFSSPLRMVQTGPTAWFAPLFPYLLAGIFKLFGVFSSTSNLIIHILNFVFSALTCWFVAWIGKHIFGRTAGIAAAWVWVVLPTAVFYPIIWVWDTSLSGLWLAMLVAATLKLRGSDRMSWWLGYGALWSAGAMINPSLISVLPPLGLWAIWPLRNRVAPALRLAAASALVFAVGIMPWTIRNYVVFQKFIPLRSNFGLELWLGNNPDVPDSWTPWLHPNYSTEEAHKYASMTEIPYMEEKQRQAWTFIRSHPADVARFALHRFSNHWLGIWGAPADLWAAAPWSLKLTIAFSCAFTLLSWLGLLFAYRARGAAAHPLAMVMLIFPLTFYLTHTSLRYRFPMDPVMLVLAVFAVAYAVSPAARRPGRQSISAADFPGERQSSLQEEPITAFR